MTALLGSEATISYRSATVHGRYVLPGVQAATAHLPDKAFPAVREATRVAEGEVGELLGVPTVRTTTLPKQTCRPEERTFAVPARAVPPCPSCASPTPRA